MVGGALIIRYMSRQSMDCFSLNVLTEYGGEEIESTFSFAVADS